jgi:acetolactate synthase I/II/III large subunit
MNENSKFTMRSTMDETSTNAQQIGAELVVRTLETRGVTHVFGIPGAKIDSVFNALVNSKIKTVVCRHEQNAAFIAGGIGRMTVRRAWPSPPRVPASPI